MLDRFHSKLHRYNHHTLPTAGVFDSASDPLGPPQDPFKGDFHVIGTVSANFVAARDSVRIGVGTNRAFIVPTTLTAQRTFTLPNSSGTVLLDTTLTPFISAFISGDVPAYVQTGTVWVDSVSGNDLTGSRERSDKPFKSLVAAQNAATNGDVVVVHPGTYSDTALGKDGVNWYFQSGATVLLTAPTQALFSYSSKSYNVYGQMKVTINGNTSPTLGLGVVCDFGGSTGTDLYFEFDTIDATASTAVLSPTPTTGMFKGTYGSKNVVIRGRSINVPKYNVLASVKNLNAGAYSLILDIEHFIIGQNIFYDTGHRLSTYANAPFVSASDYVYDDAATSDSVDLFSLEAATIYGPFKRTTTTGQFYVDSIYLGLASRATSVWNTSSTGPLHLFVDSLSTALPLVVNNSTFLELNKFTVSHSLSTQTFAISYAGDFRFQANVVSVTYPTTITYSLLYSVADDSSLVADLGTITNVSLGDYKTVFIDSVSGCKVVFEADELSGDFKLYGTDLKSRINLGRASNSFLDYKILGGSVNTLHHLIGVYKTVSGSNVRVEAVSGHAGSKLYIQGTTIFEAATGGTYTMDLSAVSGNALNVYVLGTALTNLTPLDTGADYTLWCGGFESDVNITAPIF